MSKTKSIRQSALRLAAVVVVAGLVAGAESASAGNGSFNNMSEIPIVKLKPRITCVQALAMVKVSGHEKGYRPVRSRGCFKFIVRRNSNGHFGYVVVNPQTYQVSAFAALRGEETRWNGEAM
jgi:CRISPR/Cas system-associated protein Csm6